MGGQCRCACSALGANIGPRGSQGRVFPWVNVPLGANQRLRVSGLRGAVVVLLAGRALREEERWIVRCVERRARVR